MTTNDFFQTNDHHHRHGGGGDTTTTGTTGTTTGCNTHTRSSGCCSGSGTKRRKTTSAKSSSPYEGTDAELAKEMNELSVKEREKVLEEIHGVADAREETPELLTACLLALDGALSKIPKAKRRALDKAFFLRPHYATDAKFKLMFLRADYYDPQKAAKRMAKFFEWKLKIFGEEKLVKNITILDDDLGQDQDQVIETAILSGCSLELPHRDQTGRPITMFDISKFDHDEHPKMVRQHHIMEFSKRFIRVPRTTTNTDSFILFLKNIYIHYIIYR
jgi:hypothetical protein